MKKPDDSIQEEPNKTQEIEDRARAIADMEGRSNPTDDDRLIALDERETGTVPDNPVITPEELTSIDTGDEVPIARGHQVPNIKPEDEANLAEKLVANGMQGPVKNSPIRSRKD